MNASPPRHPKAPPIPPRPGLEVEADEVVYAEHFALQRISFRHARFDGTPSGTMVRELWRRGSGVAILPYDPLTDRVALIEQFRLPAHAAGLDRMRRAGVSPVVAKQLHYEWMRTVERSRAFHAEHPDFENPPGVLL